MQQPKSLAQFFAERAAKRDARNKERAARGLPPAITNAQVVQQRRQALARNRRQNWESTPIPSWLVGQRYYIVGVVPMLASDMTGELFALAISHGFIIEYCYGE